MPKYYLVVSSVTTAQRLQRLCQKNGISVSMIHTPQHLSDRGCSYSLIASGSDYQKIISLADANNLQIRDCFEQKEDGSFYRTF